MGPDDQVQKYDGGKAPLNLLSTVALNKTAEVLGFGAQKYSAHQWRAGIEWSRLLRAAMNHLTAYNDGIDLDEESGLSHLAHAACNVMFLLEYEQTHPEMDDRYGSFQAEVDALRQKPQVPSASAGSREIGGESHVGRTGTDEDHRD